jgi:hypothetical protein
VLTPAVRRGMSTGVAAALCLFAGGSSPSAPSPSGVPTSPAASPSALPLPSPSESEPPTFELGQTARTPRNSKLTVYAWGRTDRKAEAPAGTSWYAADTKFCLTSDISRSVPISVIREEFVLVLADGFLVWPESKQDSASEVYADPKRTLKASQCGRGAVIFAVPSGTPAAFFMLDTPAGLAVAPSYAAVLTADTASSAANEESGQAK